MLYGTKGNMAACRFALLLLYMGLTKIKILDGGITHFPQKISLPSDSSKELHDIPVMQPHKDIMMNAKEAWH